MPLQRPARIAFRHPRLVLGTAATVLAGTVALTLAMPAAYQARSQVLVSVVAQSPSDALVGATSFTQAQMATYVELVTTSAVLSPVVARLGLDETPEAVAGRVVASNPFDTTVIDIRVRDGSAQRSADVADAVAQQLVSSIPELAGGASAEVPATIRVVRTTPAALPVRPVTPSWPRNLSVGLFLSICLGLAAAVLKEERARSGRSLTKLRELTGAPVLAVVPLQRAPHRGGSPTEPARDEAFRRFRGNLAYLAAERDVRVLVVTGATERSGASAVAAELAMGLAGAGVAVLLADGNLRKPTLAQRFSLPAGPGLADLLTHRQSLRTVLHKRRRLPLAVITAGSTTQSPATLLAGPALASVVDTLRTAGRVVVIDAPPLGSAGDAALLAAACDGAVLVTTPDDRGSDIRAAQAALGLAGAELLGLVLNRAGDEWESSPDVAPARPPARVRS